MAVEVGVKLFDQTDGLQVLAQREAPCTEAAGFVEQFDVADARMVVMLQAQRFSEMPMLPFLLPGARASKRCSVSTSTPFAKRSCASRSTSRALTTFSPLESCACISERQRSGSSLALAAEESCSVVIVQRTPDGKRAGLGKIFTLPASSCG
jgi:hypothetical protein